MFSRNFTEPWQKVDPFGQARAIIPQRAPRSRGSSRASTPPVLGMWSRGEMHLYKNLKLADNAIGYTHASGNFGQSAFTSRVADSLFVGETENIGNPRTPAEMAYGRSLPEPQRPGMPRVQGRCRTPGGWAPRPRRWRTWIWRRPWWSGRLVRRRRVRERPVQCKSRAAGSRSQPQRQGFPHHR